MKNVLINASNLYVGGAVQVASSIIVELKNINKIYPELNFVVYASSVVHQNIVSAGLEGQLVKDYEVFDFRGVGSVGCKAIKKFDGYDLVFTVFGPLYNLKKIKNHIVGFAQPWIIYPNNEVSRMIPWGKKIILRLKYLLQWQLFKKSSRIVVELQHVKDQLVKIKKYSSDSIDVVSNCVSGIYYDRSLWKEVDFKGLVKKNTIKIGIISRDYLHKNLEFLAEVDQELKKINKKIEYQFYVTLADEEWSRRSELFRDNINNVGVLSIAQCPSFYDIMDAVIFPSLLECFSVTPLESLVMRKPLFASNRRFIKDCCSENAIYIDPLDVKEATKKINDWFCLKEESARNAFIERAYRYVMLLPNSKDRALSYANIINKQLKIK